MITITKIHRQMPSDQFEFKGKNWIRNAWEVDCTENGNPISNAIIIMNSEDKWAEKNARDIVEGCSFDAERKDDKFNANCFKKKGRVTPPGQAPAPASNKTSFPPAQATAYDKAGLDTLAKECMGQALSIANGLDDGAKASVFGCLFKAYRDYGVQPSPSLSQDGPEPVYTPPSSSVDDDLPF